MENFRARYRIPPGVGMRYYKEGQWFEDRREGEVVILMIAFIDGGMRIPMGMITREIGRASCRERVSPYV